MCDDARQLLGDSCHGGGGGGRQRRQRPAVWCFPQVAIIPSARRVFAAAVLLTRSSELLTLELREVCPYSKVKICIRSSLYRVHSLSVAGQTVQIHNIVRT